MDDQNKNNLLVSVALLAYNRVHYLPSVIDSWLAQTYPNFELIISNDASPDNRTHEICEEYARRDKRVRYIRQTKNLGIRLCQKFTLGEARGEYFIWSADDDLRDKRYLEDCVNVFREHPELIMVFADMVDIDKNGTELRHPDPAKYMPFGKNAYERLKAYLLFYSQDGKNQLILGLWKRGVILDDPLFGYAPDRHDDYWGFDNFFVFRNLAKGPVGFVDQPRFFYRSRVLEDYRPPRWIIPRIAITLYHRFNHVFGSPYFWYIMRCIVSQKELSLWQKIKLLGWIFFAMIRVLVVRKI